MNKRLITSKICRVIQQGGELWQAWNPRRANVSAWVQRQEKSGWPTLKTVRQEEFSYWRGIRSFVYLAFNWLDEGHPLWGEQPALICFIQSNKFNANLVYNKLTEIPRIMLDQISPLVAQSRWHTFNPHGPHISLFLLCFTSFFLLPSSTSFRSSFNEDLLRVKSLSKVNWSFYIWNRLSCVLILEW